MIKYQRQPAIYVIPAKMKQKLFSHGPSLQCSHIDSPKYSDELTEFTIIKLKQDHGHGALDMNLLIPHSLN